MSARDLLARDTTSGILLLAAAVVAVGWANSPWRESYHDLLQIEVGPHALGVHMSLAHWASDGLLAVFFFVVGVELKQEFVTGSLRQPRLAGVPIAAAIGGMVTPTVLYLAIVLALAPDDSAALHGWAIPTATDIAFALAVLAVFGRGLPVALRTFLLTLAVVDDLLGIIVIATVYTDAIDVVMLVAAVGAVAVFAGVVRMGRLPGWLLIVIALVAWGFMHASGVHATVAGVLLGFVVPARPGPGESVPRTERLAEVINPWSAAVVLPVFAFAAAGVSVVDGSGSLVQPVSVAIVAGLVVGKIVGVLGATAVVTRVTPLHLPEGISFRDLVPVGMLTGVGFTVALLIAELSFASAADSHSAAAKAAIFFGSVVAAGLAACLLRWDARRSDAA